MPTVHKSTIEACLNLRSSITGHFAPSLAPAELILIACFRYMCRHGCKSGGDREKIATPNYCEAVHRFLRHVNKCKTAMVTACYCVAASLKIGVACTSSEILKDSCSFNAPSDRVEHLRQYKSDLGDFSVFRCEMRERLASYVGQGLRLRSMSLDT
jgi:hypothetical protein